MNMRSIIDKYLVYQDRNVGNNHSYLIQQNKAMQLKWATVLANQQPVFLYQISQQGDKEIIAQV